MKAIKRIILQIIVLIMIFAVLITMTVFLINSKVKGSTEQNIIYVIRGNVEINPIGENLLKDFNADCALILGCGIKDANTPTAMLQDRLDAGIALYDKKLVSKILLSGDDDENGHDEIHVMFNYVKAAGVKEEDIFCDHSGVSTYDSMYRAKTEFSVQRVLVVTQGYHLYRALYIGKKLGMEVGGVAADQKKYFGQELRDVREILARSKDYIKAAFRVKPITTGGGTPITEK